MFYNDDDSDSDISTRAAVSASGSCDDVFPSPSDRQSDESWLDNVSFLAAAAAGVGVAAAVVVVCVAIVIKLSC